MAAFTVGSLSLAGVPLFAGFVGKWNLLLGSLEAEQLAGSSGELLWEVFFAGLIYSPLSELLIWNRHHQMTKGRIPAGCRSFL